MAVILGTAGHIDHGKTTLVSALTGIDCDRLEEEKRRGITIDLGFAWLDLPDGDRLGIIDVPGHERFVRNMVAGASGIDFVMLVIAADEGVMPQTREHLEICSLLGVTNGFVCLTKTDMVTHDWLELVTDDIRKELQGTFLENRPVFPVSAQTGDGISELRRFIVHEATQLKTKHGSDIFRLPIDRVFTIKGYGTVVTGTVLSGTLATGDEVVCMPRGILSRARSLERHEVSVETIRQGSRCAMNLQGLETQEIHRGEIISTKNALFPAKRWFVHLTHLASSPITIKQRSEVHFHHGTKECSARLVFRDRTVLKHGEDGFCEVLFDQEMCGIFGDHAVIRSASPLRTVAGATLLCPLPPEKRKKEQLNITRWLALESLAEKARAGCEERAAFLAEILDLTGIPGADTAKLKVLSALPTKPLVQAMQLLTSRGTAVLYDKETQSCIARSHFLRLVDNMLARAEELHARAPLKQTFARQALLGTWSVGLPPKLVHKLMDHALAEGRLVAEGDGMRLSSHMVTLAADEARIREGLLQLHKKGGMTPPNYKDVLLELNITEKEASTVLNLLLAEGELIRIKDGLYYEKEALESILERVRAWFTDHTNLDISGLKSILGLSRKYLVALLEYMDNAHITVRVGDTRSLRRT